MTRVITFDIETVPPPGENTFDLLTQLITVVGVHDSETNQYEAFEVEEFPRLWKLLEHADTLVGYNSNHFDIPILNKYYPGDLTRIQSIDLLKEIYDVLGRRVRLDAVAEGTLGTRKSGDGLEAQRWWRDGEKDKVKSYCLKDVEITRRVFDHALEHGNLKFKELGKVQDVTIDTSGWLNHTRGAVTQTMGF